MSFEFFIFFHTFMFSLARIFSDVYKYTQPDKLEPTIFLRSGNEPQNEKTLSIDYVQHTLQ